MPVPDASSLTSRVCRPLPAAMFRVPSMSASVPVRNSGRPVERDVGLRGDVDAVVAVGEREVRARRGALDVHHVVAAAEQDVQDVVAGQPGVGDAVDPEAVRGGGAGAEGDQRRRRRRVELAAEADQVDVADLPDPDAVGAERATGAAAGRGVGEQQVVERVVHLVGGGADRQRAGAVAGQADPERGGPGARLDRVEPVDAGAGGHVQAGEAGLRQPAQVGRRVGGVVDGHVVDAGAAVEGELGADLVDLVARGADQDRVVAVVAADQRVAVDRADRQVVVAGAQVDRGGPVVRASRR